MREIHLAGQVFGYWEVQDGFIYEGNVRKWLCVCRCGVSKYVNQQNLISGKSQSCGCLSATLARNRIMDLTGQVFGWLSVRERASENRNGRVSWLCECRCGNTCVVTARELRQGNTRSCGCLRKAQTTAVDISNRHFGRLTALYPTGERDYKGSVIWCCACECGGEIHISQDRLMRKNTQSCGCLKKETQENVSRTLHFVSGTCIEFLKRKTRSDNTTGHTGVYRLKNGKYRADIGFKGNRYNLGIYEKMSDAIQARRRAKEILHKEFVEEFERRRRVER